MATRLKAHADSIARHDSLARRDSIKRADTVKAGISRAELPVLADPSGGKHWTRKDMFASGALTLQDLLDQVPGVVGLRSGWIAQPITAAFQGDQRRIRLYADGFELEELDPRMNRIWDLTQVPIWALDDVVIERTASEVRVHMRTWSVNRTTPHTRTDIYTGDQATNLYRGLFGRRYEHGEVLQIAGQEFSTTAGRNSESSDQLGMMARIGIARRMWTADAIVLRNGRNRGRLFSFPGNDTVPATEGARYDAYARLAWQDTARGFWLQAMAGASTLKYSPPNSKSDEADTLRSRSQYVFTGGYTLGPLRASMTQRFLLGSARHVATPMARASWETRFLTVAGVAEGRGLDSTRRFDVSAVIRPLSFLYVSGAASKERPRLDTVLAPAFMRAEVGVRLRDVWFAGGVMRRGRIELDATSIAVRGTQRVTDSVATGAFATINGRVWKAVYLDAHVTRWNDSIGVYRPQYQTRAELYLNTSWLSRFPTGNFHVRLGVAHEYRSAMLYPDSAATRIPGFRTISTELQFKIVTAEIFWVYRNAFDERYPQIPNYQMPRLTSIYGVRWEFWN